MSIEVSRRTFLKLGTATALATTINLWGIPIDAPSPSNLNYLKRLYSVVEKSRQQRTTTEPLFDRYVNRNLNQGRINFLLLVQGETHEPPEIERAIIGSQTIISIDSNYGLTDEVSWTHDLRAPEVERHLKQTGTYDNIFKRIDEAYRYGGFPLMRLSVEAATGLAVDFQVVANDPIIVDLIDKVASDILIKNPKGFWAYKVYINGRPYPERFFAKGEQRLGGIEALQYIKAVPREDPDPIIEHNQRKYLVMDALREKISQPSTLLKLIQTLKQAIDNGTIAFDGPIRESIQNSGNIVSAVELVRFLLDGNTISDLLPRSRNKKYLVDWAHGDGGMQWAMANAAENPISKKDFEDGIYPPKIGAEVPFDYRVKFKPNPYAEDLVTGYWLPLRNRVAELLAL